MTNPFTVKGKALPHVVGTSEIVSQGVKALEALPALLDSLDDEDAMVAEIEIWENAPITAIISLDFANVTYGWNFERWVEVTY